jgi:hypothetical protein
MVRRSSLVARLVRSVRAVMVIRSAFGRVSR